MKWFGRGKAGRHEAEPQKQKVRCTHPISHEEALFEDPANPHKITGVKCSQCGERLPLPKVAT